MSYQVKDEDYAKLAENLRKLVNLTNTLSTALSSEGKMAHGYLVVIAQGMNIVHFNHLDDKKEDSSNDSPSQ